MGWSCSIDRTAIYLFKIYGRASHSMCHSMCLVFKAQVLILLKLGCLDLALLNEDHSQTDSFLHQTGDQSF